MNEAGKEPLTAAQRALAGSVPGLVKDRVAWHVRRRPWAHHYARDLGSVGLLAVEEAARTYSAKHGTAFSSWARSIVDFAILEAIRRESRHQDLRDATALAAQWGTLSCAPPDDEKLCADQDDEVVAEGKLRTVLKAKFISAAVALSVEREEAAQKLDPESLAARRPVARAVRVLRDKLPPRQQQLLACVYDRRMRLPEAAVELGLAYPTVKAMHGKVLRGLYEQLVGLGFTELG